MDLRDLSAYRWRIAAALAVLILVVWYLGAYRGRAAESAALEARTKSLLTERDLLLQQIEFQERRLGSTAPPPVRTMPATAADLSPIDRLNYFLARITQPANELDLSYFAVTPQSPRSGPGYEEIPFTISVEGSYVALADYLYQLEYGSDFVVRDLSMKKSDERSVRADFQLSALLRNRNTPPAAEPEHPDPGRPSGLELARDPFTRAPAHLATAPDGRTYFLNVPPGLNLSGVMKTGGRMVAIINHEPYGVGAMIDNKRITRIDSRGVELSDQVRTYFLEMEQPNLSARGRSPEAKRR